MFNKFVFQHMYVIYLNLIDRNLDFFTCIKLYCDMLTGIAQTIMIRMYIYHTYPNTYSHRISANWNHQIEFT